VKIHTNKEFEEGMQAISHLSEKKRPDSDQLDALERTLMGLQENSDAGKVPRLGRLPGTGKTPELLLRDRLWWLRNLSLQNGANVFLLSSEYPVYERPQTRRSIDLLGVYRDFQAPLAKTAVIELKWASNSPLYALYEVARNAVLLCKSKPRVEASWKHRDKKAYPERRGFRTRIFSTITEKNMVAIILGPQGWYEKYQWLEPICVQRADRLRPVTGGIQFEFWTFPQSVKPKSSPNQFMPIKKIWPS
jgi:hypothetical protein